ncbi:MAG: GNAT family N-acetyltransferase [Acidiferrobacterales bacterium]|nr:GNAT family N-acetyltransferase [Acidiferrobacterales bacterium]
MIRHCEQSDFNQILGIINEAAEIYRGIIPNDRWKEPYMSAEELADEIAAGVNFDGYEITGIGLIGVMGTQSVEDVTLVRHAYVRPQHQRSGIGSQLLVRLCERLDCPILVGTWAAAQWAIAFYQRHGFELVSASEIPTLLRRYWTIPERQTETSVVLVKARR